MTGLVQWVAALASVGIGAVLQGTTGFGFAVVSIPLLAFVYDPHTAVVTGLCLSVVSSSVMVVKFRLEIDWAVLWRWILYGLLGMPAGVWIYVTLEPRALKLLIAVVVGGLSLGLLKGLRLPDEGSRSLEFMAAAFAGVLATSIGMPGPPMALYVTAAGFAKGRFRATLTAYGLITACLSVAALALARSIALDVVVGSAGLSLGVFAGLGLGFALYRKVSQRQFERAVLVTLLALAITSAATAL